jgi:uncharacterized membrane protein (DUF485 family)
MSTTQGRRYDWPEIERLPEFQQLVRGRRRWAWTAGAIGIGFGAAYVVLAATAHDLMGTRIAGSFSLGFAGGVALVIMTWGITLAYMRRSNAVWGPLEAQVRERARDLTVGSDAGADREGRLGPRETPRAAATRTQEV